MKRRKSTSLGSNDNRLKFCDDPSLSDVRQSKEVSNPLVGRNSRGKKMTGKRETGVELIKSAKKKGRLSAEFSGPQGATDTGDNADKAEQLVVGLQCKVTTFPLKRLHSENARQSGTPLAPKMTGNVDGKESDAGTHPKKKRGRPPKLQAKSPEASLAGTYFILFFATLFVIAVNHQNAPESGKDALKQKNTSESSVANRFLGKALTVYKQPVKGKRGRRRTISSINIESDPSKEKANGGLETFDDQPLARWFQGMHIVDGTAGDGEKLPFEKRSSLWETLESMQVFRMVPQKPHFGPLGGVKESLREGQAISKMVTFFRVVENTCRLRFEDPRSSIEEYLEILVDLESHGFDVRPVRRRLGELRLVKDEQEVLQGKLKQVGDRVAEESGEGERMKKEMETVDEQVRALMRKRRQMSSNMEKKHTEIGALEAELKGIKEGVFKAQTKFDAIAAASW